jgi:hypothetical protein
MTASGAKVGWPEDRANPTLHSLRLPQPEPPSDSLSVRTVSAFGQDAVDLAHRQAHALLELIG